MRIRFMGIGYFKNKICQRMAQNNNGMVPPINAYQEMQSLMVPLIIELSTMLRHSNLHTQNPQILRFQGSQI